MTRIEIKLPDKFMFSTTIPVRSTDINSAGHVGWNHMFSILDEANVRFWKNFEVPQTKGKRISRINADAGISYRRQAFHGQTLRVEIAPAEFSSKGLDLVFRVADADTGDEIARAKVGILWFDYDQQKVAPIPQALRDKLAGNRPASSA